MAEQAIEEATTCAICHEVFKDPRSLRCGHMFCCTCLSQCKKACSGKTVAICPLCRHQTILLSESENELPKSFNVANLAAKFESVFIFLATCTNYDYTTEIVQSQKDKFSLDEGRSRIASVSSNIL